MAWRKKKCKYELAGQKEKKIPKRIYGIGKYSIA